MTSDIFPICSTFENVQFSRIKLILLLGKSSRKHDRFSSVKNGFLDPCSDLYKLFNIRIN